MTGLNYFIDVVLLLYSLYFLVFVVLGMFDNDVFGKEKNNYPEPENKFAIFIPAHNEAKVISKLLKNLEKLEYPSRLHDVFVIADNCQDNTAKIAGRHDVNLLERTNRKEIGKGYALKYGFKRAGLLDSSGDYDAVVAFDADNLVKENFLQVMNSRLLDGEKLIQAYVGSKNPADNWVTATFSMMFWVNDRFTLLSRYNVGLSAVFMGTGMCLSAETLKETDWETVTLTEDLEYSIKALFKGIKTSFTRETKVFDEKPVTFFASCKQRLRWARGQMSVIKKYVPRLFYQAIEERSLVKLDATVRLFQTPFIMFYFLINILRWTLPGLFFGPVFTYILSNLEIFGVIFPLIPFIMPVSVFLLDKLPERAFKYVPLFPVFLYSWAPVLYYAVFTLNRTHWLHTSHFRNISKDDLKARELAAIVNAHSARKRSPSHPAILQKTKVPIKVPM